jgi:UDP-N-acetylglucosamine--N-acetylmuramyl-(pentapeptide) pyrophosphoryl-undecaprenol N-acetylglucosamine transferase
MRIVLTGGGTGGHFYPLIAVAEAIEDITKERTLIEPELFYLGPSAFDVEVLREHDIVHVQTPAGRVRRYRSILNFFDIFKTVWGIITATIRLFGIYPDVVFSTGGYAAYPALFAARLLMIPVVIYDADATPGRVSLWSAKFARWIALAHPDAVSGFPDSVRDRIARTGHPIRKEIEKPANEGGHEFLKLESSVPTVFIMGGSQGSVAINNVVMSALSELVKKYNIVHQVGSANLDEITRISKLILRDSFFDNRYRAFGLLNTLALRMIAGISSLVVSRAGSGSIFEIASWGIPTILIPIPEDISHDQKENAYSYARSGAADVLEQRNVTPHLLIAEIDRILNNSELQKKMSSAALSFARPQSARKIGTIIIDTALEHQPA